MPTSSVTFSVRPSSAWSSVGTSTATRAATSSSQATTITLTSSSTSTLLNAGTQFFPLQGPQNSKKKTNNVGHQKDTKDVEIALLKQELVIAKTKLLQLESDKKRS